MSTPKLTFNPFTSTFDYIYPEDHHGGYSLIATGVTVKVETNKVIYAHDDMVVDGSLILDGTLTILL